MLCSIWPSLPVRGGLNYWLSGSLMLTCYCAKYMLVVLFTTCEPVNWVVPELQEAAAGRFDELVVPRHKNEAIEKFG